MDLTGLGSIADLAGGIINKIWPPSADPNEKLKAQAELERMLNEREGTVIDAQKNIIVAEMSQGDSYTKRARPTIVYAGLAFIFMVHVVLPMLAFFKGTPVPSLTLPAEFWWAWTGVCGIWIIGRSAEKVGTGGAVVSAITGSK